MGDRCHWRRSGWSRSLCLDPQCGVVLLKKSMLKIAARFARQPPVHPEVAEDGKPGKKLEKLFERGWKGAQALA